MADGVPPPAAAPLADANGAFNAMGALGAAGAGEVDALQERKRALAAQNKEMSKEIKKKEQSDARRLNKAAKHLSAEQLVQAVGLKAAAKAKTEARAKAKAKAKAKATAHAAASPPS